MNSCLSCIALLKIKPMKTQAFALLLCSSLFFAACSKDTGSQHNVTFSESEGIANNNGEYTMQGTITSPIKMDKILLTKEGQSAPFISDTTTAKNKTEHTYSYQVTGITQNTYIRIDVYNMEGGKSSSQFLIKRP